MEPDAPCPDHWLLFASECLGIVFFLVMVAFSPEAPIASDAFASQFFVMRLPDWANGWGHTTKCASAPGKISLPTAWTWRSSSCSRLACVRCSGAVGLDFERPLAELLPKCPGEGGAASSTHQSSNATCGSGCCCSEAGAAQGRHASPRAVSACTKPCQCIVGGEAQRCLASERSPWRTTKRSFGARSRRGR